MIRPTSIVVVCLVVSGLTAQKPVVVVRPERAALTRRSRIPGTIIPEERFALRARVTGYLAEIPVDDGSAVARGDLLCKLAVPDLDAALMRARAELAEAAAAIGDAEAALLVAKANTDKAEAAVLVCTSDVELLGIIAKRKRVLVAKRGATQAELDEADGRLAMGAARAAAARAGVAAAKAAVQAAERSLDSAKARRDSKKAQVAEAEAMASFATLRCPLERAVVTSRRIDPGALVDRGETVILELARVDKLRIRIPVPEREASRVRPGTVVDLRFDALPQRTMQARVSRTSRSLTSARVMWIQVDVDNADGKLMPGMFVHAALVLGRDDAVLTLPAAAVHYAEDGSASVLIVAGGKAKRVPVETGKDDGIRIEITKGLAGSEDVIAGGSVEAGERVVAARPGGQR